MMEAAPVLARTCSFLIVVQTKTLVKVGKMLKKNNVAADVVSMGETDDNQVQSSALFHLQQYCCKRK